MTALWPTPVRRPHVVVHVAVSVDGSTSGFEPDVGRFYALTHAWAEDVTLAGADTILAQEEQLAAAPRPGPAVGGPLLAVVDGRRRVSEWDALRECGHWSDVVALRAWTTPPRAEGGGGSVRELITGFERVDLGAALRTLAERDGAMTVRVDSGGALIGALLQQGLVDELSLLVHPYVSGRGEDSLWHGPKPPPDLSFAPIAFEALDRGLVWLRYRLRSASSQSSSPASRP